MSTWDQAEQERLSLQSGLDAKKTPEDRNRMGQFATPTELAREVLAHGMSLLPPGSNVQFLDPAIGTGSFYSALRVSAEPRRIERALGFEVDEHYYKPARDFWANEPLQIRLEDFTKAVPREGEQVNLLICNPPYVRHHHIEASMKAGLQQVTEEACGVRIGGLAGLYCYFMGLAHRWMAPGAVAGWLIPSEFMDVNYGRQVKHYLLKKVTLLQIHRFDPEDAQFSDALVSSAVVWFRNAPPPREHNVTFTYGGTLAAPRIEREVSSTDLIKEGKWTRYPKAEKASVRAEATLGDLFDVKRGLATGDNGFFIMDRRQIEERGLPIECFTPVLPSSRHIPSDEIEADNNGLPLLEKQLFLLDTRLSEDQIALRYPRLKTYLDMGFKGDTPVAERYLCKSRRPWYAQENRPAAPIICTYMGRGSGDTKPFRFILNHSRATACNVYLMLYPRPLLAKAIERHPAILRTVWEFLCSIEPEDLKGHGRVYGGGLHKLEPMELRGFPADALLARLPELARPNHQMELLTAVAE